MLKLRLKSVLNLVNSTLMSVILELFCSFNELKLLILLLSSSILDSVSFLSLRVISLFCSLKTSKTFFFVSKTVLCSSFSFKTSLRFSTSLSSKDVQFLIVLRPIKLLRKLTLEVSDISEKIPVEVCFM